MQLPPLCLVLSYTASVRQLQEPYGWTVTRVHTSEKSLKSVFFQFILALCPRAKQCFQPQNKYFLNLLPKLRFHIFVYSRRHEKKPQSICETLRHNGWICALLGLFDNDTEQQLNAVLCPRKRNHFFFLAPSLVFWLFFGLQLVTTLTRMAQPD